MEIVVVDKQKLLSDAAIQKAESRAHAAFAKFGFNVISVNISVIDVNGPRGGVDKECRVVVNLRKMKDLAVTVQDESLSKALPSAINRAARSVGRLLDRRSIYDSGRLSRFSFDVK